MLLSTLSSMSFLMDYSFSQTIGSRNMKLHRTLVTLWYTRGGAILQNIIHPAKNNRSRTFRYCRQIGPTCHAWRCSTSVETHYIPVLMSGAVLSISIIPNRKNILKIVKLKLCRHSNLVSKSYQTIQK